MNKLLNYYKEKNKDKEWYEKYKSSSKKIVLYPYIGTNSRHLDSLKTMFQNLETVEGIKRD